MIDLEDRVTRLLRNHADAVPVEGRLDEIVGDVEIVRLRKTPPERTIRRAMAGAVAMLVGSAALIVGLTAIEREFGNPEIIDVTSKGNEPWVKFSPFYPHGDNPVPFLDRTAQSVEGIWQALKVFENEDVTRASWT